MELYPGPSTIGLVPPKTRAARIDALRQVSDFAKQLGIPQVQTHCGFIPENPADPLYPELSKPSAPSPSIARAMANPS